MHAIKKPGFFKKPGFWADDNIPVAKIRCTRLTTWGRYFSLDADGRRPHRQKTIFILDIIPIGALELTPCWQ